MSIPLDIVISHCFVREILIATFLEILITGLMLTNIGRLQNFITGSDNITELVCVTSVPNTYLM